MGLNLAVRCSPAGSISNTSSNTSSQASALQQGPPICLCNDSQLGDLTAWWRGCSSGETETKPSRSAGRGTAAGAWGCDAQTFPVPPLHCIETLHIVHFLLRLGSKLGEEFASQQVAYCAARHGGEARRGSGRSTPIFRVFLLLTLHMMQWELWELRGSA